MPNIAVSSVITIIVQLFKESFNVFNKKILFNKRINRIFCSG